MNKENALLNRLLVFFKSLSARNDELNFIEFFQLLYYRKHLILIITALFFTLSFVYVIQLPIEKQARLSFKSPQPVDVQGFASSQVNVFGINGEKIFHGFEYNPSLVYRYFLKNYQSKKNKRKFFVKNNLINYYPINMIDDDNLYKEQFEMYFDSFCDSLRLHLSAKEIALDSVSSTLFFFNEQLSKEILEQYAKMVRDDLLEELIHEVKNRIQRKEKYIQDMIVQVKKINEHEKKDKELVNMLEKLEEQKSLVSSEIERFLKNKSTYATARINQKAVIVLVQQNKKMIVISISAIGFIISIFIVFVLRVIKTDQ